MQISRLVFLGVDGLPWSLARTLCAQGQLPHLATVVNTLGCQPIRAELPELSPVNWSSFFTASTPGEHGVYGFTRLDPVSYQLKFTDFTHVQGQTIFERLAAAGFFAKVVNMPNLAPVRPMRALLVAGFPAQSLLGSVHPPALAGVLADLDFRIEADTVRGAMDPGFLLEDLHRSLGARQRALDLFWSDLAWDQFFFVVTETDRLGHFLFPALLDPLHPWHRDCLDFMTSWDELIGHVLERYTDLPEPKRLIIMADHGFTSLEQEVDLNVWLRDQGLLHLSSCPSNEWDASVISSASKAFALDPGRIYLHTTERFDRGRLGLAEAQVLLCELEQALTALTCQGRKVVRQVVRGKDLYHGPQAHLAPDLVLVPEPGFDLKGKFNRTQLYGHYGRQGMHTADDVFYFDSEAAQVRTPADVGRNILEHFGISTLTLAL